MNLCRNSNLVHLVKAVFDLYKSSLTALIAGVAVTVGSGLAAGPSVSAQTTVTNHFDTSYDYISGTDGDPFFSGRQFNGGLQSPNSNATLQAADANMTTPGQLTLKSTNGYWEHGADNGILLYRNVTGNFSATVHVTDAPFVEYNTAGLMARNPDLTNGENWIGVQLIGNYGAGPSQRNTINSLTNDTHTAAETNYTYGYLTLTRVGDSFTTSYSTDGQNFTPIATAIRNDLPETLQIGLYQGSYSGNQGTATFDDFSITAVPEPSTWAAGLLALGMSVYSQRRRLKLFAGRAHLGKAT